MNANEAVQWFRFCTIWWTNLQTTLLHYQLSRNSGKKNSSVIENWSFKRQWGPRRALTACFYFRALFVGCRVVSGLVGRVVFSVERPDLRFELGPFARLNDDEVSWLLVFVAYLALVYSYHKNFFSFVQYLFSRTGSAQPISVGFCVWNLRRFVCIIALSESKSIYGV